MLKIPACIKCPGWARTRHFFLFLLFLSTLPHPDGFLIRGTVCEKNPVNLTDKKPRAVVGLSPGQEKKEAMSCCFPSSFGSVLGLVVGWPFLAATRLSVPPFPCSQKLGQYVKSSLFPPPSFFFSFFFLFAPCRCAADERRHTRAPPPPRPSTDFLFFPGRARPLYAIPNWLSVGAGLFLLLVSDWGSFFSSAQTVRCPQVGLSPSLADAGARKRLSPLLFFFSFCSWNRNSGSKTFIPPLNQFTTGHLSS